MSNREGYAITIPAGSLQQRSLVTVTPLAPQAGIIPRADFHIGAPWSGQVTVSLPWQPADAGLRPIVLHEAEDGLHVSAGAGVETGEVNGVPTASTKLSSLSPVSMAGWSCEGLSPQAKAAVPMCANANDVNVAYWFNVERARTAGLRLPADPVNLCGLGGSPGAHAVGSKPKYVDCTTGTDAGQAKFQFRNASEDNLLLWRVGAVYKYQVGANTTSATVQIPDDSHWLIQSISNATKGSYLVPGAELTVGKNPQSPTTRLQLEGDLQATAVWYELPDMASVIDAQLAAWLPGHSALLQSLQDNCSSSQPNLRSAVANCVRDNLRSALDAIVDGIGSEPPAGKLARFKNAASVASALLRTMDAATYTASLEAAAAPTWPGPTGALDLRAYAPLDPPTARGGTDYIARDPETQRAVRVLNGQPYSIPDGNTFDCLALSRVVWDLPALAALDISPTQETACENAPRPVWTYTPTASGGNTGTDVILRNPTGSAWLINSAGEIQTIEDGGTYLCLARTNPVVWSTPDDKIHAWTPVGSTPATCGGSSGTVQRVSVDASGTEANGWSYGPVWSPDGTQIAFSSHASNLVPGAVFGGVFVKTLASGAVQVLSAEANNGSYNPAWSPDGTRIAFSSHASNLVPADTNGYADVFVKTLASGAVQRVSVDASGTEANRWSDEPVWSPDGTRIAFTSEATDLVPGDIRSYADVFVKTLASGAVQRVSGDASGTEANSWSGEPVWSPDGTRIVFTSWASNLVPADTNGYADVFVKTLASGAVQRVSVDASGTEANSWSGEPVWSPDGTQIAFSSHASNLVPGDTNDDPDDVWSDGDDVFVKTLASGAVQRVSVDASGTEANDPSGEPVWSPDGTQIAFTSWASNLVPGDTSSSNDVFVKTLASGAVQRVSVDDPITSSSIGPIGPVWSPDGTRIAFASDAPNLVPGDTNGTEDVFVKALG